MFEAITRGRRRIYATNKTREFGITDPDSIPEWGKDWHRKESTPHKYRAGLEPNSNIRKAIRSHGLPYIAGPSGTAADCAEGLHFLIPDMSKSESQEYFNYSLQPRLPKVITRCMKLSYLYAIWIYLNPLRKM